MIRERHPIPDPEERPKAYREADILEALYVDRGWRRQDIAEYFGVDVADVRRALYQHDIESEDQVPTNGLARKLWKIGKAEAMR